MKRITLEKIKNYRDYLVSEEKGKATIEKYIRDITKFYEWLDGRKLTKTIVLDYKHKLIEEYSPATVNSILASLSSFFKFNEWFELKVKNLKLQRAVFSRSDKELTKQEYERLLTSAKSKKNEKLYLIMQTICSTGIRVSELKYITVESLKLGQTQVKLKGKIRTVILTRELCKILKDYAKNKSITEGCIFITRNGNPVDRHSIWKAMKRLCEDAKVAKEKVFPHNLRHLFARTFYTIQKDIVRLADILGHSSINTTRIYTIENGDIHRQQMHRLGLIRIRA